MLRLEEHVTSMRPDAVNAMGLQQEAYFREYDRVDVDRHPETGRECADDGDAKTSKQKILK